MHACDPFIGRVWWLYFIVLRIMMPREISGHQDTCCLGWGHRGGLQTADWRCDVRRLLALLTASPGAVKLNQGPTLLDNVYWKHVKKPRTPGGRQVAAGMRCTKQGGRCCAAPHWRGTSPGRTDHVWGPPSPSSPSTRMLPGLDWTDHDTRERPIRVRPDKPACLGQHKPFRRHWMNSYCVLFLC